MGFRTGAFAKVWEVTPQGESSTKVRLSISKKNKQTDKYEEEFSGFVMFYGDAARAASKLDSGARIKLGDCDVTTKYDKAKDAKYTNFKVYSFESTEGTTDTTQKKGTKPAVDDGEVDPAEDLPF